MKTPALAFFLTRALSKKKRICTRPCARGLTDMFRNELDLTFSYIKSLTEQAGVTAEPSVLAVAVFLLMRSNTVQDNGTTAQDG